jgi:hypothetical protein
MADEVERRSPHDPAARGYDGRLLTPVDPPAPGEAPSPAWLAQLGRAPFGEYADDREVVKRLTEDGYAVPGDDPLYQFMGAHRVFVEVLKAQHEEHLGRTRSMLDEARRGLSQLLAEVAAAGGAAVAARRGEDEAALKRFSAELEDQAANATRKLREAMAEERDAVTAAVAVKVAEALARIDNEKSARAGRGRPWRPFGDVGPAWAARGRSAAAWAALLVVSVIAGLVLLWAVGHLGSGHGGR